jgi:hypothetical protein
MKRFNELLFALSLGAFVCLAHSGFAQAAPADKALMLKCAIGGSFRDDPNTLPAYIEWTILPDGTFKHYDFEAQGVGPSGSISWGTAATYSDGDNMGEGVGEIQGGEITYTFNKFYDRLLFPEFAHVYKLTLPYPIPLSGSRRAPVTGKAEEGYSDKGKYRFKESFDMVCEVNRAGE